MVCSRVGCVVFVGLDYLTTSCSSSLPTQRMCRLDHSILCVVEVVASSLLLESFAWVFGYDCRVWPPPFSRPIGSIYLGFAKLNRNILVREQCWTVKRWPPT